MAVARNVKVSQKSYKTVAAELNGCVVVMPIAKTLTDGATVVNDSGLPIPSPLVAAHVSLVSTGVTGTFLLAASYKDSVRDRRGAPTSLISVVATNDTIQIDLGSLSNKSTVTTVDTIEFWRSLDQGNILFKLGETSIAASVFVSDATDAAISVNDDLKVNRQAYLSVPADRWAFVDRHGRRLFYGGDPHYYGEEVGITGARRYSQFANRMGWSPLGQPDVVPPDNQVEVGGDEPIRSFCALGDAIIIFKEREIHMWTYHEGANAGPDGNTGSGSIDNMELGRGTLTWKSRVPVDGAIYAMDRDGWYVYRGGQSLLDISEQLQPLLDRINWEQQHLICGTYDDKRIYWFLPLDEDTECRHAVILDRKAYESGRGVVWWPYYIPMGVRDCTNFVMGRDSDAVKMGLSGRRVAKIQTTAGYEYIFGDVYRDGVHPELTATGLTSAAGSVSFACEDGAGLGNDAEFAIATGIGTADLAGAFVKFDDSRTPEPLLIASSVSNQLTLADSLGFDLPSGTTFTVGGIDAYWKSGWIDAGDPHDLKQGYDFDVVFQPLGLNAELNMRPRGDRLAPRIVAASGHETGYELKKHEDFARIDMGGDYTSNGRTGFASVPFQTRDFGHVQIELFSDTVDCPWKISSFSMTHHARNTDR